MSELSANTQLTTELYQLKIKTLPGKGLFEASISRDVNKNIFSTKVCTQIFAIFTLMTRF
jgi:hypothetical protein